MLPLPAALRARLVRPPRVVVAPVAKGYGQDALISWAQESGRQLLHDPGGFRGQEALLVCERRSCLSDIPTTVPLSDILVIEESQALFELSSWSTALPGSSEAFRRRTFEESEGWPYALALVRETGEMQMPLHRHPLARVAFERILPKGELRDELERACATPLLVPELLDPLGLKTGTLEELIDLGHLTPARDGWTIPRPLRNYLAGQPEKAVSLAVAHILMDTGHLEEALAALAHGGLWDQYLEALAHGFDTGSPTAETRLRRALAQVPSSFLDSPAHEFLLGSLERMRGELDRAQSHFRAARREADGELLARIDNSRGVTFAMKGSLTSARQAFGAAIRAGKGVKLEGEARYNRAGVFIQQGRFEDAESDLRVAVTRFRESGDYAREARSLQLLALSWHHRGLLEEAKSGYEEALGLLGTLGRSTALLRTNLAEVLLILGQAEEAAEQLESAAHEAQGDSRAQSYVEVGQAMLLLEEGSLDEAQLRLEGMLRQEELEANLVTEARLLLSRAYRLDGKEQEALEQATLVADAMAPNNRSSLGVAAALELALAEGAELETIITRAREEEARFELAVALLERGEVADLHEALELIRSHGYRLLLDSERYAAKLAALGEEDPSALKLFPLTMSTFGSFEVRFLGKTFTLAEFPTRKSVALLVRLALASRSLSREALAEELWADAGNPLQSLQTALYHLNRTLGAQVVSGRKGMVELQFPVRLDLLEFEERAAAGLEGAMLGSTNALRSAIAVARGEPLADFPEWFDEERRGAEALLLRLWRQLAEQEAAEPQRAADALEVLLRLDPYDLDSRRQLIEIYRRLGEGELARRQEERLRVLEGEL